MRKNSFIKPTETELDILSILWKVPQGSTVGHVHSELSKNKIRKVGYTTTLKLMQLMLEKKLVKRNTSSRAHLYMASMSQETAQKHYYKKMVETIFSGSAVQLVRQAIGSEFISKTELSKIKDLIASKE